MYQGKFDNKHKKTDVDVHELLNQRNSAPQKKKPEVSVLNLMLILVMPVLTWTQITQAQQQFQSKYLVMSKAYVEQYYHK